MNASIAATLKERGTTHGDYTQQARTAQLLKMYLREGPAWSAMQAYERDALEMIAVKISRILTGNPHFDDHWRDIAGYAQLVADRCPKEPT